MDDATTRHFLHQLNNALNAAKLNAFLLRRLHTDLLDPRAIDNLDAAIQQAEQLTQHFQQQFHNPTAPHP